MPATEQVLTVRNLKKKIRGKWIIKGVSFDIRAGEVFGFLGPNGSGKTTTIRMLVRLIKPTEGTISVCGVSMSEKPTEALKNIGCIVENPELYSYLTGWENLEHFARMLPDISRDRIQQVVEIVGMDKRIHDKVKTYSLGMRQRLGIAQALLGRPKLLILDEPTNGLDPQGIKEMREFIRELASTGLSVFVSSHLLSEIQLMCDRVAIITQGSVIAVGEVDELIAQTENIIVWKVDRFAEANGLFQQQGIATVTEWSRAYETEGKGPGEIATHLTEEAIPGVNQMLVASGIGVSAITHKIPTLEDLFLRLTEGEQIG
ncbi:ABC transporter ATP-binding protein [Paenibacillus sp. J2TS4]|uniref:ABC transporter ATP-binding protein n=1 Tax=Paenibacillus sp. J2TS4 TaxID=2807194 RepID=UPI001B277DF5|nr:ABC transporter ATP-binding protein [Paenibacillus sp. J2TS4]GIP32467.1 ABC transporter ATP-binding protein [Paenibacillus sp. J2TS4]